VAHRSREKVDARHPILVTTRVMPDVARLRTKVMYEAIQEALACATKWMYEDEPVRFVHASVQGTHLHLLLEAASNEALSRAMKGFLVSCAKRLKGELSAHVRLDPYSSAFALPHWGTGENIRFADVTMQVALPKTWLLREGWRRAGPISPWETPSA
jgi:REP element-mobilizing transposase RayT